MSLRSRLVIAAAAAVAAAVALASVLVYFIVRNDLRGQIDTGLREAATQIRVPQFVRLTPGPKPNQFVFHAPGPDFGDRFPVPYRLVRSNGTTLIPEGNRALESLPVSEGARASAAGRADPFFTETHISGIHARVFTTRFEQGTAVQVATSLTDLDHELGRIRLWLGLVAVGGIGLAAVAGFVVARAALAPVRRLSETAEHVRTTRDLSRRIDVSGSDELSQLAATFNAMLESLDEAAKRQRRLVQDASHELRTPLTSLRTNIELLASNDHIPAEEREHMLSDVVGQLTEMTVLIGELTELARGEEQQPPFEEIRLDAIAEEAIRRTARNHPEVAIDADLAPATAVGMPATLERAMANLLDNAAKWSPAGERVDVQLRAGELTVRDRGPGIAENDLPHVFDRFYRATSARSMPGSGLGLAIVKQVAEAHGGAVTAEQAPDGGTIMRFSIPSENGADKGADIGEPVA